jgi:hypothetical protein
MMTSAIPSNPKPLAGRLSVACPKCEENIEIDMEDIGKGNSEVCEECGEVIVIVFIEWC